MLFCRPSKRHIYTIWYVCTSGKDFTTSALETDISPQVWTSIGKVPAGQPLLDNGNKYVHYEFVIIGLFWTILWCVKASFLALYYRLFDGLPKYRKAWWAVVIFTVGAYIGCWVSFRSYHTTRAQIDTSQISSVWTCHPPANYFHFGQCNKPIDQRGGSISIIYTTVVDVLTDS